jgi:GTP cyclohydrolase IV
VPPASLRQADGEHVAFHLDRAAERANDEHADGGAEITEILSEQHRCRGRRDGRDRELRAVDTDLDQLEATVAQSRLDESRHASLGRLDVDAHFPPGPAHRHPVLAELRGRGAGESERVDRLHVRLVAAALDARREPQLVEQLGELARGQPDHLDVTLLWLAEIVHPDERLREPVDRREGCAQVVGGKRDEPREAGVAIRHSGNDTNLSPVTGSRHLLHDLQASSPEVRLGLSRAGVQGVSKAIRLRWGDAEKLISAEIDCTVDLDPAQKGVHMSRFPELFEEAIDEVVIGEAFLVEELADHIARHIVARQAAGRAEVRISAHYPLERRTPVTGLATQEMIRIIGIAAASTTRARRVVGVEATGINACPCAQGLVRGKASERLLEAGFDELDVERILELVPLATHNQRGLGTLYVGSDHQVNAEQLAAIVEGSMSSPIYELLKRPDELFVVEHAHLQPRFVEDSVRVSLQSTLERYPQLEDGDFLLARQLNFETIHSHEVLAERHGTVGELRTELEAGEPAARHTELREWLAS